VSDPDPVVSSGADAELAHAMTGARERAARDAELRRMLADPDAVHHEAAAATELDRRPSAALDAVAGLCTRSGGPSIGTMDEAVAAQLGVVDVTILGVRPDRYIGLRDDSGDPRVVAKHLDALVA
jgi:hypothetical protein